MIFESIIDNIELMYRFLRSHHEQITSNGRLAPILNEDGVHNKLLPYITHSSLEAEVVALNNKKGSCPEVALGCGPTRNL